MSAVSVGEVTKVNLWFHTNRGHTSGRVREEITLRQPLKQDKVMTLALDTNLLDRVKAAYLPEQGEQLPEVTFALKLKENKNPTPLSTESGLWDAIVNEKDVWVVGYLAPMIHRLDDGSFHFHQDMRWDQGKPTTGEPQKSRWKQCLVKNNNCTPQGEKDVTNGSTAASGVPTDDSAVENRSPDEIASFIMGGGLFDGLISNSSRQSPCILSVLEELADSKSKFFCSATDETGCPCHAAVEKLFGMMSRLITNIQRGAPSSAVARAQLPTTRKIYLNRSLTHRESRSSQTANSNPEGGKEEKGCTE